MIGQAHLLRGSLLYFEYFWHIADGKNGNRNDASRFGSIASLGGGGSNAVDDDDDDENENKEGESWFAGGERRYQNDCLSRLELIYVVYCPVVYRLRIQIDRREESLGVTWFVIFSDVPLSKLLHILLLRA